MADPIWKDHFSDLGSVASQYFRIQVGGTTIYQGKAVRAASSGKLYVRINDICADYMSLRPADVPALSGSPSLAFPVSFTVQKSSNGSSWSTVETVAFNDDWSYDSSFNPSTDGMSFPITGRADIRQKIFQTRYASGSVTAGCLYGSTSRSITLSLDTSGHSTAFSEALVHAGVGNVMFDCNTYKTYSSKTLTQVTIGNAVWTVVQSCARFVLYYKNPFGGYDHLLMEGTYRRKKSISRDLFVADYDNRTFPQRREEWNWQNEVTDAFELHTGFMPESASVRMVYLLDSPDVYLCDLLNPSVIIPCIISNDSYDIQTYHNNGRQLIDYGLEVRVAQKEYRR